MTPVVIASLFAAVLLGCDDDHPSPIPEPKAAAAVLPNPSTQPSGKTSSLTGQVLITGWKRTTPQSSKINYEGKSYDIPDETVVLNPNGSLRNVVVYIKDAPSISIRLTDPVVLDQVNLRYTPHVVAIQTGQTLRVKSSDQTLHNVHMHTQANSPVNFGMMRPGTRDMTLKAPEFFRVKCDVHPWMSAHVAAFNHPFFSVTNETGHFQINNIPTGTYTLSTWHEKLGELEQSITIIEQPSEATFTYAPPD